MSALQRSLASITPGPPPQVQHNGHLQAASWPCERMHFGSDVQGLNQRRGKGDTTQSLYMHYAPAFHKYASKSLYMHYAPTFTRMNHKVFMYTMFRPSIVWQRSLHVHYAQASHSMTIKSVRTLCSGLPQQCTKTTLRTLSSGLPQYDNKVFTYTIMLVPPAGMHQQFFFNMYYARTSHRYAPKSHCVHQTQTTSN